MNKLLGMAAIAFTLVGPALAMAQVPTVKTQIAEVEQGDQQRVFFGRVVARQTVDLAFQVDGQIVKFPLEEGTAVPAGSLVAEMDLVPFELALNEAKLQNSQAERTVSRFERLVGSAVTATSLEDAETDLKLSEIAVRNAERSFNNATLHAPFDAIVSERLVPNFSTVSAGTPVVRLHDMSDLRVEIDVPETLLQRTGTDADVEAYATFPASDTPYPLTIREFNAETESAGQTYTITLGMTPPEDLNVFPGSSAKVTAVLKSEEARLIVPNSAVVLGNNGEMQVMIIKPTEGELGTVTATPVEITPTNKGAVEVLSGLEPGQEYVLIGGAQLNDGDTVRRFVGFGD